MTGKSRAIAPIVDRVALSYTPEQGMALTLGRGPFNLREHQVNAIWRALVTRKSLNAHEVGTGKTFTMGGIAVESPWSDVDDLAFLNARAAGLHVAVAAGDAAVAPLRTTGVKFRNTSTVSPVAGAIRA